MPEDPPVPIFCTSYPDGKQRERYNTMDIGAQQEDTGKACVLVFPYQPIHSARPSQLNCSWECVKQRKKEVGQETSSVAVILRRNEEKSCRGLYSRCMKGNCFFRLKRKVYRSVERKNTGLG